MWLGVLIISLISAPMFSGLGVGGTFGFFALCSTVGFFYFLCFMRSTQGLDKTQLRELYYPDSLKSDRDEFMHVPSSISNTPDHTLEH